MTTHNFIILAAGRGSRVGRIGDTLHKSLLPLENKAIITHQLEMAPRDSDIFIVVGYLADQVVEYVRMAHPDLKVTFIYLDDWAKGGPAYSLKKALARADRSLPSIFVTCDTLWDADESLWQEDMSWLAVAPIPFNTTSERWMIVYHDKDDSVRMIFDKEKKTSPELTHAWTGLAMIMPKDVTAFTKALDVPSKSVGNAFQTLRNSMKVRHTSWVDVGDEAAYRSAVIERTGYDWTKVGQATYILPTSHRVVKFFEKQDEITALQVRHTQLGESVAPIVDVGRSMFSQLLIDGPNLFKAIDLGVLSVNGAVQLAMECFDSMNKQVDVDPTTVLVHGMQFYKEKTMARVAELKPDLQKRLSGLIDRVPWGDICTSIQPSIFHGDFTLANIVYETKEVNAVGVDVRPRFITVGWGDRQYDMAKLLSSGLVNWDAAAHGSFQTWSHSAEVYSAILERMPESMDKRTIEIMAGLCLINSAPLHAAPFDEILVTRGASHLEGLL